MTPTVVGVVAILGALVGAITGAGGLIVAWRTSRASAVQMQSTAKREDVEVLRGIIAELREELRIEKAERQALQQKYTEIRDWVKSKFYYDPETRQPVATARIP